MLLQLSQMQQLIVLTLHALYTSQCYAASFAPHMISSAADGAESVFAIDMDGDGDIDVLSASKLDDRIAWYENNGVGGFMVHDISTTVKGASCVFAIDMDGDNDIDVLATAYTGDEIYWFENDGAQAFTRHLIETWSNGARSVFAIDMDNDGDIDVLSASQVDGDINWYENNGLQSFTSHRIRNALNGARDVYAIDMDGDGDMDILSAYSLNDGIHWHENDGSQNFDSRIISSTKVGAVYAIDMDNDGDIDILSASDDVNKVVWYENNGFQSFTAHTIQSSADGAFSVYASDIDGDGDMDVVSALRDLNSVVWYENNGFQSFTPHTITSSASSVLSVYAVDVNGDSTIDILSASYGDDSIRWYSNTPPTSTPTHAPTSTPTNAPTLLPTTAPTIASTHSPTTTPTSANNPLPTSTPTHAPTSTPTNAPTLLPTTAPTIASTQSPTATGVTNSPSYSPTTTPTNDPTHSPTHVITSLSPTVLIQEWEGGTTDADEGVKYTFTAVDTTHPKYLTVEVFPTDFDGSDEYANVTVNGMGYGMCNPDDACGEAFYKCFQQLEIDQLVDINGNLQVEVIGTSEVGTFCAYEGSSLYVRYTLSSMRTFTSTPTNAPTLLPTTAPTIASTQSPTATGVTNSPTYSPTTTHSPTHVITSLSPTVLIQEWEGGTTDADEGVKYTFTAVDTTHPKYLTVEVFPTDFDGSDEYANVTVNGMGYGMCNPDDACGEAFYKCFRQLEIDQLVDINGNLQVEVIGTSEVGTFCAYEGSSLYVRYTLSSMRTPTAAPTSMYDSMCGPATDCFHDASNDEGKYIKCDMCVCDDFGTNDPNYDDDENCGANEDLYNCFIMIQGHVRYCKTEMKAAWVIGFIFIAIAGCCGVCGCCAYCCRYRGHKSPLSQGRVDLKLDVFSSPETKNVLQSPN